MSSFISFQLCSISSYVCVILCYVRTIEKSYRIKFLACNWLLLTVGKFILLFLLISNCDGRLEMNCRRNKGFIIKIWVRIINGNEHKFLYYLSNLKYVCSIKRNKIRSYLYRHIREMDVFNKTRTRIINRRVREGNINIFLSSNFIPLIANYRLARSSDLSDGNSRKAIKSDR